MAELPKQLSPPLRISIYAGDIGAWASGSSSDILQTKLQFDNDKTYQYFRERGMDIPAEKSAVLPFTREQKGGSVAEYSIFERTSARR